MCVIQVPRWLTAHPVRTSLLEPGTRPFSAAAAARSAVMVQPLSITEALQYQERSQPPHAAASRLEFGSPNRPSPIGRIRVGERGAEQAGDDQAPG
jgi:hypothetical protein